MGGGGPTSIYLRLDVAVPDAGVVMSVGLEVVGVVVAISLGRCLVLGFTELLRSIIDTCGLMCFNDDRSLDLRAGRKYSIKVIKN